jgi:hypothetical protein
LQLCYTLRGDMMKRRTQLEVNSYLVAYHSDGVIRREPHDWIRMPRFLADLTQWLDDAMLEPLDREKDTIVAREGVASGEIEQDRLRRERQTDYRHEAAPREECP